MTALFGMVFPGQGSQSVGMLADLARRYPVVGDTFAEASRVLGFDLWRLVQEGPKERLDDTLNTQPAMLVAGVSVYRAWSDCGGPLPQYLAGHSLGELSALVVSGALDFEDAVALVVERARLMQQAVPGGEGAMAAILGLADEQVRELCVSAAQGQVVEAVNFNAPGQVVVAGVAPAVARLIAAAKTAGAKRAIPLPVSVPSHCRLMVPAADLFAHKLAATPLQPPAIAVLHNVTVAQTQEPEQIRDLLRRQLYSPVRWVETIRTMAEAGVTLLLEMGPGKVLAGLGKRIDGRVSGLAVLDPTSLDAALEAIADVDG